jgi:hypothetical protein
LNHRFLIAVNVLLLQKFSDMAVTRLERKGRKNKTVAKERVATIKRLRTKDTTASPFKEESGVIIGTVADVLGGAKPKAKKEAKEEKVVEEPKAEAVVEETTEEVVEETTAETTEEEAPEASESSEAAE